MTAGLEVGGALLARQAHVTVTTWRRNRGWW